MIWLSSEGNPFSFVAFFAETYNVLNLNALLYKNCHCVTKVMQVQLGKSWICSENV